MKIKINDLAGKIKLELRDMIVERKREILNLNIQRVNGKLTNPARYKIIRREIAMIKTYANLNKHKWLNGDINAR